MTKSEFVSRMQVLVSKENGGQPLKHAQDVAASMKSMDNLFNAAFTEGIKNELNLSYILPRFVRIANEYDTDRIVTAVQWLTSDWKLRSIIAVVTGVTEQWVDAEELAYLITCISRQWKPKFTAELVYAVCMRWEHVGTCEDEKEYSLQEQTQFVLSVMRDWNFFQASAAFMQLGDRLPWQIKAEVFKAIHSRHQKKTSVGSLEVDAGNSAELKGKPNKNNKSLSNLVVKCNQSHRFNGLLSPDINQQPPVDSYKQNLEDIAEE
ncbi:hypothetical protein MP228_002209 [Amoeboaphelidium protococcarum]|nr:hypothetical protein MP228_002209 [Amoeboaphelidium protococcarum]